MSKTNYFTNCKNEEEVRSTYKELVKKYHPDIYGEKGNDILKEVHNQLEKALKQKNKTASVFNATDAQDSEEIRAKKEEIAKNLYKKYGNNAYSFLFVAYWQNGLRPANHRNPITKHNFSGWNIWQLELKMLVEGYTSSEWATFAQLKEQKQNVNKGEHGAYITLAVICKNKEAQTEEEETYIYYKGYTVFNMEQTKAKEAQKQLTTKDIIKKVAPIIEQKNLWGDKYETVA